MVPFARIAPALIYFTGSGLLCRHMRGQAMKLGLRLNEKWLIDLVRTSVGRILSVALTGLK